MQTGLPTSEENDILLQTAKAYLQVETINYIAQNGKVPFVLAHPEKKKIVQTVTQKLEENQDWGKIFKNNENPFLTWLEEEAEQTYDDHWKVHSHSPYSSNGRRGGGIYLCGL